MIQEFPYWGELYKVEFKITVTNVGSGYTNVLHFTASNNGGNYGDRIPGIWIHSDGYFHICSAVSDNYNECINSNFELEKTYQISIQQYYDIDKEYIVYEIKIDGVSKLNEKNSNPKSFSNVKLYASDPWYDSFSGKGSICNVIIQHQGM